MSATDAERRQIILEFLQLNSLEVVTAVWNSQHRLPPSTVTQAPPDRLRHPNCSWCLREIDHDCYACGGCIWAMNNPRLAGPQGTETSPT